MKSTKILLIIISMMLLESVWMRPQPGKRKKSKSLENGPPYKLDLNEMVADAFVNGPQSKPHIKRSISRSLATFLQLSPNKVEDKHPVPQ